MSTLPVTSHALPYRPEIDGLRAVAVLPVLLFHAHFGFPGGFVGVDVFFVISGYLIASILIKDAASGRFSYRQFWLRRIRRLFPAWILVVIITSLFAFLWMVPKDLAKYGQSLIAQPLLSSNFYFYRQTGYFDVASEYQPLLHTWSLSVEEQFYLFLPLILVPLLRRSLRLARLVVVGCLLGSLAWSVYLSTRAPSAAYFLLPTRIWELDLGVLLALLPSWVIQSSRLRAALVWLGLGMILTATLTFSEDTVFPGYAALLPCVGAVFVILGGKSLAATTKGSLPQSLLASRPMVFIGRISYPLYLWHWPCLVMVRYYDTGDLTTIQYAGALSASLVLAWLTWRWVETPVRLGQWFSTPRSLLVTSSLSAVVMMGAGLIAFVSQGLPERHPENLRTYLAHQNESVPHIRTWAKQGNPPRFGAPSPDAPLLLVWGDSHAGSLKTALDEMAKRQGVGVYIATMGGFAPLVNAYPKRFGPEDADIPQSVIQFAQDRQIKSILLVANWQAYTYGDTETDLKRLLHEGEGHSPTSKESVEVFRRRYPETLQTLQHAGLSVYVMKNVSHQERSVPELAMKMAAKGIDPNVEASTIHDLEAKGRPVRHLLDELTTPNLAVLLDPLPCFDDGSGRHLITENGHSLYADRHHLTLVGARKLRPLLEPVFTAVIARHASDLPKTTMIHSHSLQTPTSLRQRESAVVITWF